VSRNERLACVGMFAIIAVTGINKATDPDLGWHLRAGQYMLDTHEIVRADPFSWTMPGYPWIDHEWATDIAMYLIYRAGDLTALAMVWALLILLTPVVLLLNRSSQVPPVLQAGVVLVVYAGIMPPMFGVRPQMLSLLFLAIVALLLARERRGDAGRSLWLLPPLFCLWANLHGGFVAGLMYLVIVGAARVVEAYWHRQRREGVDPATRPKALRRLGWVIVACVAATFLNAYGPWIYREVIQTASDKPAMTQIGEWQAPGADPRFAGLWVALLAAPVIVYFSKRRASLEELLVFVVFAAMGIRSARNIAVFAIVMTPVVTAHLSSAWPRLAEELTRMPRWFGYAAMACAVLLGARQLPPAMACWQSAEAHGRAGDYPWAVVAARSGRPLEGRGLCDYGWGGYLLWKLPGQKVFIDGRMAIWKQGSYQVFRDYCTLLLASAGCVDALDRYRFDWILMPKGAPLCQVLQASRGWRGREYPDGSILWTPEAVGASRRL
jgi:hypothetical protein